MPKPNPKTDRELAVEILKLLRQKKTIKEIRAALSVGERRLRRILSEGKALKPEPPKAAADPKKAEKPAKPAPKPAPKKAEKPAPKAEAPVAKPAPKKGECKCKAHVHAMVIEGSFLSKFLMALEFACGKIFSLGVEIGKKEKASAKPPRK